MRVGPPSAGEVRLASRLRALRAFSLPVSVMPALVAVAAVAPVAAWRWDVVVPCVLGVGLLHAAGNMLNDYFDFRFGLDQADDGRPGLVMARGEMTPRQVLVQAVVLLAAAVPLVAYLVWRTGPGVLAFGGVGAVGLYVYTGWPLHLKYRALGEPLIFLVFGPVLMLGAAYAHTGQLEPRALLASLPIGFATTAVLLGNNVRDRQEDAAAGIRTLASFGGGRPARAVYVMLVVGFAGGLAALAGAGLAPRVLVAMPVALLLMWRPLAAVWRGSGWGDLATRTAQWETVLLLIVLAAYLVFPPAAPAPPP